MSKLFERLKSNPISQPISAKESKFFSEKSFEGAPYLYYNGEDFQDLMGHEVTYFENGVLLSIKEKEKYFPESKSYVFYNNTSKRVFKLYNTEKIYDRATRSSTPIKPKFDIEIRIHERLIYVKEIQFETKEENEYFIDVRTGDKIIDVLDQYEQNNINSL